MFLKIFENFREASQNEIEGLIKENNVNILIKKNLKHQLKSTYSMLILYLEKSEEIIQLNDESNNKCFNLSSSGKEEESDDIKSHVNSQIVLIKFIKV